VRSRIRSADGVEAAFEVADAAESRGEVEVGAFEIAAGVRVVQERVGTGAPVLHGVAKCGDVEGAGGVEDHVFVLGIQRLPVPHRAGRDDGMGRGDVTGVERLGRGLVLADVAGGAHEHHRVLSRQRHAMAQPRHRRERVVECPGLVAVPLARRAQDQCIEPLAGPEQPNQVGRAGRTGPARPIDARGGLDRVLDRAPNG
jgi:hypothetical protein